MQLKLADESQKAIFEGLGQFYYYDLAQVSKLLRQPFRLGRYDPIPYLDNYWQEANRWPYLIFIENIAVGFALVHDFTLDETCDWKLSEFFVMGTCRRRGIGNTAAEALFSLHTGRWEISVLKDNKPAQLFWSKLSHESRLPKAHQHYHDFVNFYR